MGCNGSKVFRCCGTKGRPQVQDLEALVDGQEEGEPLRPERFSWEPSGSRRLGVCVGCLLLFVVSVVGGHFLLVGYITGRAEEDLLTINHLRVDAYCGAGLTMATLPTRSWWPGCKAVHRIEDFDGCAAPCFSATLIQRMEEFNRKYPGKLVTYDSRSDVHLKTVKLRGWWLPAPNISGTPKGGLPTRVVVQHNVGENSNAFRTQLTAYMLRSLGFSVLLNNLRDHCYSEDSRAKVKGWGHSYPFDVLGAWDYASSDPDGLLGGSISVDKVGVMGFSVGAYATAVAFGMEPRVPAAWLDSSPYRPKDIYDNHAYVSLGPLGKPLLDQAWSNLKDRANANGVPIDQHLPEKELPRGPDTGRHVGWVHNKEDRDVPFADGEALARLLESMPTKYDVTRFETEGECNGESHAVDSLRLFNEYAARLCTFWTEAFGLAGSGCLDR